MPSDGLARVRWTRPPALPPEARRWAIWWVGSIGTLSLLDAWRNGKADGTTVSELTRHFLRTETPPGKGIFLAGLFILARHILATKKAPLE